MRFNREILKEANEQENKPLLRIYVGTYGKYNNGDLHGAWIDLPTSDENLEKQLKYVAQGEYDPEYMIQDYESAIEGMEPSESENIHELNEIMKRLEDMYDTTAGQALGIMLANGYSFEEAMNKVEEGDYSFVPVEHQMFNKDEELGYAYLDYKGGIEELGRDVLERNFNYESFGRDLRLNDGYEEVEGGYIKIF